MGILNRRTRQGVFERLAVTMACLASMPFAGPGVKGGSQTLEEKQKMAKLVSSANS